MKQGHYLQSAIVISIPKLISIVTKIAIPLPFPISLEYAIGNDNGIINIKNISYMFDNPVGFSKGCAEFEPKNPPPLLPNSFIDSNDATGPMFVVVVVVVVFMSFYICNYILTMLYCFIIK